MIPLYNFSNHQRVLLHYALSQFLGEGIELSIPTREKRALAALAGKAILDPELAAEAVSYSIWFYSRIMSGEDSCPPTLDNGYQCLPLWFSRWSWEGVQALADCARFVTEPPSDETLQSIILRFFGAIARSYFGPNWVSGDLIEDLASSLSLYSG